MKTKLLDVPFVGQKPGYCGPAALAMVMQYFGEQVTQDEIGLEMCAEYFGATMKELADFAESKGFKPIIKVISLNELINQLSNDLPVIVAQKLNFKMINGHYRVVIGYDERNIVFHDPELGPSRYFAHKLFSSLWESCGIKNAALTLYVDSGSFK